MLSRGGSAWEPLSRLSLGRPPASRESGPRKRRPARKGLITEFLKQPGLSLEEVVYTPSLALSVVAELILVDLSESLLASQSALGSYWDRGVRRKRDRPELVDICQEEDSSEGESSDDRSILQVGTEDKCYDSCDSEDMNTGFRRYKECNLADWLGTRLP